MTRPSVRKISAQQHASMTELFSRGTNLNCFDEAELLIDAITSIVATGVNAVELIKWITMLPRVKDRAGALAQAPPVHTAQMRLMGPVDALPMAMQSAIKPSIGQTRARTTHALLDPSIAPTRDRSKRRPDAGVCRVCSVAFEIAPGRGRTPATCPEHRRAQRKAS